MNDLTRINSRPADPTVAQSGAEAHASCSGEPKSVATTESVRSFKDPVCGMTVTDQSAQFLQHQGQSVYFCSAGCRAKFVADPAKYSASPMVAVPESTALEVVDGTIYT